MILNSIMVLTLIGIVYGMAFSAALIYSAKKLSDITKTDIIVIISLFVLPLTLITLPILFPILAIRKLMRLYKEDKLSKE